MANNLTTNPIVIDTFSADFTIKKKGQPIRIKKIRLKSAADGDIFVLEDSDGTKVVWLTQTGAGDCVEIDFGAKGQIFDNGLFFDHDDTNSGLGSGDLVWIYL